jgi:hypothetical protein
MADFICTYGTAENVHITVMGLDSEHPWLIIIVLSKASMATDTHKKEAEGFNPPSNQLCRLCTAAAI